MKTLFLLILSYMLSLSAFAQADYLVTAQNDTLYGEVTILLPTSRDEPVRIKTDVKTRQFSAHEVREGYIDGIVYKTIRHAEKYRIMKEVLAGYLGLYEFRADESHEFGSRYLYKITTEGLEVSMLFFRKSVTKFLSECDKIVKGLNNKQYKYTDVEQLVQDYNSQCVKMELPGHMTSKQSREPVATNKNPETSFEELRELNVLINDVLNKLENEEPVPGYMREALQSYTNQDLNQMIQDLLDELGD